MENWKKNLAQNVNWRTAKASEALNFIRLSLDKWVKRSDLALPFSHLKNWFHTFLFSFCINHWNDKKAPQIFGFILFIYEWKIDTKSWLFRLVIWLFFVLWTSAQRSFVRHWWDVSKEKKINDHFYIIDIEFTQQPTAANYNNDEHEKKIIIRIPVLLNEQCEIFINRKTSERQTERGRWKIEISSTTLLFINLLCKTIRIYIHFRITIQRHSSKARHSNLRFCFLVSGCYCGFGYS